MQDRRRRTNRGVETAADRARRFRWRIRLLTGAFSALFGILAIQALSLMALSSDERLKRLAERQHNQVVTLYPKRGAILDRNGLPLAVSVETDSVYADPKYVKDAQATADALAGFLQLPKADLLTRLEQQQRFVWLERRIGPTEAQAIRKLRLPGIHTIIETRRFYPNRELAASLLGFTNIDNVGIEGLERFLEESLNGKVSKYVRLRDAKGRDIHPEGVLVRQTQDGGDVVLTLDRNIQYMAEQALNRSFLEFNAKGGFVIVLDPKSGEVLAMANAPGYNPNAYSEYPTSAYKNQAVVNTFEPGSTQKCILMAAALNEAVVNTEESFDCENGAWRVGRNIIHDTHKYGILSLRDVLKFSSNIGSAKIGEKLGGPKLIEYYKSFGYGESTKVGLPGEIGGILRNPKKWSRIGLATNAFGQGMTVTGMQIATAFGALANNGLRMKPFIIKEKRDQDGKPLETHLPTELARVISPETSHTIREYMISVTEEGGTGTKAAIEGYTVGGKTGTAQKVDPETRRYAPGVYVSSFVGFLPVEDPRLVIVAVLDEPRGAAYYGGTVAGPIFADVARGAMSYLGVPTSPVRELVEPVAEAHADPSAHEAPAPAPKKPNLREKITLAPGSDASPDQDIPSLTPVKEVEGEQVEAYVMPDFTGQTMRSVLAALDDKLIALTVSGSGLAIDQTPKPGETIRTGETVSLIFSQDGAPPPRKKTVKR